MQHNAASKTVCVVHQSTCVEHWPVQMRYVCRVWLVPDFSTSNSSSSSAEISASSQACSFSKATTSPDCWWLCSSDPKLKPPLPMSNLIPSFTNIYPQPPTPSTAGFPLTPSPPGLYFDHLDMNAASSNRGKDQGNLFSAFTIPDCCN